MTNWVVLHEPLVRGGAFLVVFATMGFWEALAPCRARALSKPVRWVNNLALAALNAALVRMLFPAAAVGMAAVTAERGWGLLNLFDVPLWFAVVLAVTALDFVIWLQHVILHAIPLLWRVHRVHHADLDYDVTTGSRFHPIEIVLSMLIKFAAIAAIGAPVIAVLLFEVLLNTFAVFTHANVRLPAPVDRLLRWWLVTPDMHRVHHSIEVDETNSNFGFNLSWWDRLFGTYRAQPRDGHQRMTIGIHGYGEPCEVSWLTGLLMLPFRNPGKSA